MLRFIVAGMFVAHGVAHLVGFVVPWRFLPPEDGTVGTTVFGGRLDVGESGIKAIGIGWLALALASVVVAGAVAAGTGWAVTAGVVVLALSFVFCLVGLPEARVGLVVNLVLAVLLGFWAVDRANQTWTRESGALQAALAATDRAAPATADAGISSTTFDTLPAPVARYLRRVLDDGQLRIRSVDLEQEGEFFLTMGRGAWEPLSARQRYTMHPPGFVWEARIRMAPFVDALVRDAYVGGRASMTGRALGLVPLVDQHDRPELDAGALMRYLGEAVWFPTVFAPGGGVSWTAIDDRTAHATLADGGTSTSLEFRFNDRDEIVEVFAPDRYREVAGRFEPTPWRVTCREYARPAGILIPTYCEAAWLLPEGPLPYWRGRITSVSYGYEYD